MSGPGTGGRAESIRQQMRNDLRARGEDVTLGLPRYVVERLGAFLQPVWADLGSSGAQAGDWPPGGPWR
jgi:hypothetical protein